MILPIIAAVVVRAAAQYAVRQGMKYAAKRALQRQIKSKISKAIKEGRKTLKQDKKRRENCKNCKRQHELKNPCSALRKGGKGGTSNYRGGSYSGSRNTGIESNHMPARAAYPKNHPFSGSRAPAIQMKPSDHRGVVSTGSGGAANAHRSIQRRLIKNGKTDQAFAMDAADIISKTGDTYAEAIGEAAAYLDCLKKFGKL